MNSVRVLFLASLFLLSGCFELLEEIWINPDGSARMKIDIGMSEAMLSMGQAGEEDDPFADLDKEFLKTKAEVEKNPKVRRVDFQQYTEGGLKHFVFDIEVTDYAELSVLPGIIYAEDTTSKTADNMFPLEQSELQIEQRKDGNIIFVRRFGKPTEEPQGDSPGAMADEMGDAFAGAMFGNYHYTVRLHAADIISSNGKINDAKKMVEWKIPMGTLIAGGTSFQKEFRAEIAPPTRNIVLWILIGILAVAIAAGLIGRIRKKGTPIEEQT